ncbi:MAG: VPLPA-CTERM sorting domain-containing protein [Rhodobacteraceae bacterium]|nr:VPLPA-CTERM sorting domain-containing protein [Paracoccaceae bacterium]
MFSIAALRTALVAGLMGLLAATGAKAAPLQFSSYLTGTNLGKTTIATLDATQDATGVIFTLTHTLANQPSSFVNDLFLDYSGSTQGLSANYVSGINFSSFSTGSITNAGYGFNIKFDYPTSNGKKAPPRLTYGLSSTFKIVGATLANFNFGVGNPMLHMNGLNGGGSTKYGPDIANAPVPAAGVLLFTALGGIGALRARRRSS